MERHTGNSQESCNKLTNKDIFCDDDNFRIVNSAIFNTMRILKKHNPADTYLENYLWHSDKRKDSFLDIYHIMWWLGANVKPKNIMEIGCRTGISLCQLLSSMMDTKDCKVYLFDIFNDGFISPDVVKMNLKALNIDVEPNFIVGDSLKTVPDFQKNNPDVKFDYILVDGNHDKEYAKMDMENAVNLLSVGGTIIMDDLSEDGCNLKDVWESFKYVHADKFDFYENYDGKGFGMGIKR